MDTVKRNVHNDMDTANSTSLELFVFKMKIWHNKAANKGIYLRI
jgi:hypothetical protein